MDLLIEKIVRLIKSGKSWINESLFVELIKKYIVDENEYCSSNALETNLYGKKLVNQIKRRFIGSNKTYTTIELIKDLKKKCNLKQQELSELFERNPYYITNIKQIIRNQKHRNYNPNYKFSKEDLAILNKNLEINHGNNSVNITDLISLYLKNYSNQQYHLYHPKLKSNFFKDINNKEKAYWLGFLCADGYINKTRKGRFGIELSSKDKNHLRYFCKTVGLENSTIVERERTKKYK
ncbi:MAG: hypothetical protein P8Y97_15480 [Candidatus Lokiarchaeota archaeon]